MSPSDDLTITVSAGTRNPREAESYIQNVPTAAMHCNSVIALLQSIKLETNTKVYIQMEPRITLQLQNGHV